MFRYAKANHPGVEDYNPLEPHEHLGYLDANNLYGWAMSQFLPLNNFKWMSREDIDLLDIGNIPDEGDHGYILEVDLGIFISDVLFYFILFRLFILTETVLYLNFV